MRPPSSQRWRPTWTNHSRRQSWPKSTSWGCFFQPKEDIFCQYIHIWCPSCQEWHYWSSTRNWRLDPRHVRTHFQPFLILLSFSFQFWNPPQIRSQVTFDTAGHCSHPPWTIWGGSRHRWHSLEVLWHLGQLQVLGTTHFSCRLPPCCRPLLLATVSLSNQGEMSCLLLQQSPSSILSEIAPATASAISQLLPKYLDQVVFPPAKEKSMENLKYPGLRQSCGRWSAWDHCSLEGDYFPSWILTQLWPTMENSYENTSFSIVLGLHLCAICISCLLVIKLFQPKKKTNKHLLFPGALRLHLLHWEHASGEDCWVGLKIWFVFMPPTSLSSW